MCYLTKYPTLPAHNQVLAGAASAVLALVEVRSFSEQAALFPASLYIPYQQRRLSFYQGVWLLLE